VVFSVWCVGEIGYQERECRSRSGGADKAKQGSAKVPRRPIPTNQAIVKSSDFVRSTPSKSLQGRTTVF